MKSRKKHYFIQNEDKKKTRIHLNFSYPKQSNQMIYSVNGRVKLISILSSWKYLMNKSNDYRKTEQSLIEKFIIIFFCRNSIKSSSSIEIKWEETFFIIEREIFIKFCWILNQSKRLSWKVLNDHFHAFKFSCNIEQLIEKEEKKKKFQNKFHDQLILKFHPFFLFSQ